MRMTIAGPNGDAAHLQHQGYDLNYAFQTGAHITYTDLLVKLVAATLAQRNCGCQSGEARAGDRAAAPLPAVPPSSTGTAQNSQNPRARGE